MSLTRTARLHSATIAIDLRLGLTIMTEASSVRIPLADALELARILNVYAAQNAGAIAIAIHLPPAIKP